MAFPATLVPGTNGLLTLQAGATGGLVSCWIDFNRDGDWGDAGEQVVTDLALGRRRHRRSPPSPCPSARRKGTAPSRCRISTPAGLGVTGLAPTARSRTTRPSSAVEDPQLGFAKRLVSVERDPGNPQVFRVIFEMTLENLGNVPLSNVNATDGLRPVFAPPSPSRRASPAPTLTVNPAFDGAGHTPTSCARATPWPSGETGVITLSVASTAAASAGPFSARDRPAPPARPAPR